MVRWEPYSSGQAAHAPRRLAENARKLRWSDTAEKFRRRGTIYLFLLRSVAAARYTARAMFSHVVIFWTNPANPNAADELAAGMEKYLRPIPGVRLFHVGRMVPSHRPVVEQSYQVALNLTFDDKQTQDDYQVHPLHLEFVEKVFKPNCVKAVIYDFE